METLIRIGEVAAGVVPFVIGFIIWLYKKGGQDQERTAKIDDLARRMKAVEDKGDDIESDVKKVTSSMMQATSAASSGMRPIIDNAKAVFDRQIGELHEKINRLTSEINAKINADTRDVLDTVASLRTDIDVIKSQYGQLFDALSAIEANVTAVLKSAEGEKVRIEGLEKWRSSTETNLRDIDKTISALQERTSRGK